MVTFPARAIHTKSGAFVAYFLSFGHSLRSFLTVCGAMWRFIMNNDILWNLHESVFSRRAGCRARTPNPLRRIFASSSTVFTTACAPIRCSGPVFEATLAGRWDDHLPKMCTFWGSLVLGAKQYRGNVQQAHQPLEGVEPQHFSRWLYLFLDTVESRYQPAAAVRFMEPALRIAQSLQLSRFGWDYKIPAEQQALLERVAPKRRRGR